MDEISKLMESAPKRKQTKSVMSVVFWLKDKKISKEPVSNIKAESDRLEGLTTQVRFGNGKSYYSAKILKISEDEDEVDTFLKECLEKMNDYVIEKSQQAGSKKALINIGESDQDLLKIAEATCKSTNMTKRKASGQTERKSKKRVVETCTAGTSSTSAQDKETLIKKGKAEQKIIDSLKFNAQKALADKALAHLENERDSVQITTQPAASNTSQGVNANSGSINASIISSQYMYDTSCQNVDKFPAPTRTIPETQSVYRYPTNSGITIENDDQHSTATRSNGCITEAMNTVLYPETNYISSLYRPLPVYPADKSYTYLTSSSEKLTALQERNCQLLGQLAEERANHSQEMENLQASHARQLGKIKSAHARELERVREQKISGSMTFDACGVTPGKVKFLKDLTSTMERKFELEDDYSLDYPAAPCRKRLCLDSSAAFSIDPSDDDDDMVLAQQWPHEVRSISGGASSSVEQSSSHGELTPMQRPDQDGENLLSPSTLIPLVEGFDDVLITKEQRSRCILRGDGKAELLIRELLSIFFTLEELAGGNALGKRKGPSSKSVGLNYRVINAIKRFVLLRLRQEKGVPVLKDKEFNAVINSKCATARRALQSQKNNKNM